VISRATETRFVCTQPQAAALTVVEPSAAPCPRVCVCAYPSHSSDHRTGGAAAGASLNRETYNGARQTQRTVSWTLDFLSVLLWIQL